MTSLAFSAACLILCVACDSLAVSLAVILTMGGISVGLGRLPLRRYLSLLSVPPPSRLHSGCLFLVRVYSSGCCGGFAPRFPIMTTGLSP